MRARKGIAFVAVVAVITLGLAVAPAGAADDPIVTVTPATDLVDGDSVHVAITGTAPQSEVFVLLCPAGAQGTGRCDGDVGTARTTDQNGAIEVDLGIEAVYLVNGVAGNESIDCRVAPGCVVFTMSMRSDNSVAQIETPLGFRPDGPLLPPPTLTTSPTSDLIDGQRIQVTGDGFVPGTGITLTQCRADFTDLNACERPRSFVSVTTDGTFVVPFDLVTIFRTNAGDEVDCRSTSCVLAGSRGVFEPDPRRAGVAPLAFRPEGPLLPPPTMTVTPDAGLVNGQVVTVTGAGFRPGSSFAISECGAGTGSGYDRCLVPQFVVAQDDGTFTRTMPVQSLARLGSGFVDCRQSPDCTIAALELDEGRVLAEEPIAFDPAGPLPPAPTVNVAPGSALAARSPVIVTGSGFPAQYPLELRQCRLENGIPRECADEGGGGAQTDAAGKFVAGAVVTAVIPGPDGTEIDCRQVTCGLTAAALGGFPGVAPLTFQPSNRAPSRYLAPVFDDVDVTDGVVYRHTTTSHGAPIDLALDVYRPAGDTATNRPAIVWMFGGYFGSGDRKQLRDLASAMARRGYVSVAIDYRTRPDIFGGGNGCVDVGGTCLDATQLGPAITDARDDARAAMMWVHDHAAEYGIEPRAISAAGWSAGAITALNLAHDHTADPPAGSVPAAAVSLSGILTAVPQAADPPTLMLGGNRDSLLAMKAQIAGCGLIVSTGGRCRFVAYSGLKPDPAVDDCVQFAVPCTYVLGRDSEHGFFFGDRPDVIGRISGFLARNVLQPVGLLPGGNPPPPPPPHHHHHHHHHDGDHHHDEHRHHHHGWGRHR